jgi:hypothetical protein
LVLATTILGCAALACAGEPGPSVGEPPASRGFFDSFVRGVNADFMTFGSLREMVEISDVVVIGRIERVGDGRTFGGRRGERGTVDTLILHVRVDEVVRGDLERASREIAEIEVLRPEVGSVEELHAQKPDEPLLFILQDTADQPQAAQIDDSGADHSEGKRIYTVPTFKGAFIDDERGLRTPFDPSLTRYDRSVHARTLEELADEIREM